MPAPITAPISPVDTTLPGFERDRIANYAKIRQAGRLVYVPAARSYLVTGYDDVVAALHDRRLVAIDYIGGWRAAARHFGRDFDPVVRLLSYLPFLYEGERHAKLRAVLANGLGRVARGHPAFAASIAPKAAALRERGGGDLAGEFSRYLLFDAMCDLMRVPNQDRSALRPIANMSWAIETTILLRKREQVSEQVRLCLEYFDAHARATAGRSDPGLLDDIFRALPADETDKFGAVAAFATMLFIMGNDAVGASVSLGVQRLLSAESPPLPQERWSSLSDGAIRYSASLDYTLRVAEADTAVAGCPIAKGEHVVGSLMSANHDPARYGAGHANITASEDVGLAFGIGRHACPGRGVSRTLVRVAFEALAKLPNMRLAGPAVHGSGRLVRTLDSLPVEFV